MILSFPLPAGELIHHVEQGTLTASSMASFYLDCPVGQQIVVLNAYTGLSTYDNYEWGGISIFRTQSVILRLSFVETVDLSAIGPIIMNSGNQLAVQIASDAVGPLDYEIGCVYVLYPEPRINLV